MEEIKIQQLIQDDKNFNQGTEKGQVLLNRSFENFGAARSVLIDKNNRIIAGNKSAKTAEAHGIDDVIVVDSEGDELIAIRRVDLDLDSREGRELALADNMTSKANMALDYNEIRRCMEEVQMDVEAWGIKDIDKYIERQTAKEAKEKRAKERKELASSRASKDADVTPVRFKGYSITPTKEEYDRLNKFADDYYEENGVVIGLVGELLGI